MKPVKELFNQYMSCQGYRESTIDSKSRAVAFYLTACGDLPIDSVTYGHAEDYQTILRQGGRAAKTVNLYTTHMSHFFGWAVKRNYIKQSPFFGLKKLAVEQRKMPTFSDNEIVRLLNVADMNWKVLISFGMLGLREGEVLNLVVKDLLFDEGFVLISPKKDTFETWEWGIKNRTMAYAPFPEYINLPDYSVNFHTLVWQLIESHPGQPYVCVKPKYYEKQLRLKAEGKMHFRKKLCPWGNFDRDFKGLLKKACVPKKSFHDLRRSFADKMRKSGYDLKEIQSLMRHKSITTTAQYYVNIDEQKLVARANGTFEHYQTLVP